MSCVPKSIKTPALNLKNLINSTKTKKKANEIHQMRLSDQNYEKAESEKNLFESRWCQSSKNCLIKKNLNKARRLPENSHNSFVDLQSQKTVKKGRPKKLSFH